MSEYKIKTPAEKIREEEDYRLKRSKRHIKNALNFLENKIIVTNIPGKCRIRQSRKTSFFPGFTFNVDKNFKIISMAYDDCSSDDFELNNQYELELINSTLAAAGYTLYVVMPPRKFGIFRRKPYLMITWDH